MAETNIVPETTVRMTSIVVVSRRFIFIYYQPVAATVVEEFCSPHSEKHRAGYLSALVGYWNEPLLIVSLSLTLLLRMLNHAIDVSVPLNNIRAVETSSKTLVKSVMMNIIQSTTRGLCIRLRYKYATLYKNLRVLRD